MLRYVVSRRFSCCLELRPVRNFVQTYATLEEKMRFVVHLMRQTKHHGQSNWRLASMVCELPASRPSQIIYLSGKRRDVSNI
jgi:hypothetical protein